MSNSNLRDGILRTYVTYVLQKKDPEMLSARHFKLPPPGVCNKDLKNVEKVGQQ